MTDFRQRIDSYFTTVGKQPLPKKAFLLVGSNPLPVYAAVLALAPEEIYMLGTAQVAGIMDTLKKMSLFNGKVKKTVSCDGADSVSITVQAGNILKEADGDIWLFYTAGTKAMAVHSFRAWEKMFVEPAPPWAIYLSADGPAFWFHGINQPFRLSDGRGKDSVSQMSLQDIITIHSMEKVEAKDHHIKTDSYATLANRIHDVVLEEGIRGYLSTLPPTYEEVGVPRSTETGCPIGKGILDYINFLNNHQDNAFHTRYSYDEWDKKINPTTTTPPLTVDTIMENLLQETIPAGGSKKCLEKRAKKRISTLKWLATEWLETWVASALKDANLFDEIHDSYTFVFPETELTKGLPKEKRTSEVDVVAVRSITPFVFSCTIDEKAYTKYKLFEVRQRANQLGGDHARAAVVCLSDNPKHIKAQLNQGWEGYGTIEVFGKADLKDRKTFGDAVKKWINKLEG